MDGQYPVVLVCLGHCCLPASPDSFFRRWFLPGLPLKCSALRSSSVAVPLGYDSSW